MTLALSVSNLLFGAGLARLAMRHATHAVILEWVGGSALITGLASFGYCLARY